MGVRSMDVRLSPPIITLRSMLVLLDLAYTKNYRLPSLIKFQISNEFFFGVNTFQMLHVTYLY